MKEIELYDILTLSNDKDYTVLKIIDMNMKKYYLLSETDKEEVPNLEKMKIVEKMNDKKLSVVKDEKLLSELTKLFASALEEEFQKNN